ncbi:alkaline phosphatase family protein [Halothermothrix orenii]|uniref:alkaline phosphatase family protein n=1 Tax=Halothermothrix orenii TaxID=31909 RepID=UPI0002FA9C08|nr:alkaline phosphatase family protein [Halothermothrix orenii]
MKLENMERDNFTEKNTKETKGYPGPETEKMLVLGLDGVPYSFLKKAISKGVMPNVARLIPGGQFKKINSVIPTVSSAAWASFMTGLDPAGHNIFGFVDRYPDPFQQFIPTARHRRGKPLWVELGEAGKKSIVINVPVTYPPDEINGVMISGFLATNLKKAVYPDNIYSKLQEMGYIIDANTWTARKSKKEFLKELHEVLQRRFQVVEWLIENRDWDYFHCHIMETDRINHFFWRDQEEKTSFAEMFYDFYRVLDRYLGKLIKRFEDRTDIILLSDHGFCTVHREVQLNSWLMKKGYLLFDTDSPASLRDMSPRSKAYSLIPGRIYINCKGREEKGTVGAGEYFELREELKEKLLNITDNERGCPVIKDVFFREEIYNGPYLERAPDLLAVPCCGYDLKSNVEQSSVFNNSFISGMHSYDDAFILSSGRNLNLDRINSIKDVKTIIIEKFTK